MILIACVDEGLGLCFNRRRQSRDRLLRARILAQSAGGALWMNAYSAGQFAGMEAPQLRTDPAFPEKAGPGEFAFFEDMDPAPFAEKIEKIILYRWNRAYPADLHFSLPLEGWKLEASHDFAGWSHPRITEEIYIK